MPGDTVSKRVKDISTKVKKGNIKEQKIPSQTAGSTEDAVLPKLVDRNGSLGLQLIILGVFCAVIGVVLFGLPSFQNYSDVHAVGKSITQWLHNIDVYFNIVSDNGPEKTEIVVERPFGRRKFSKRKPKHEIDETVRTGKNSKETNDRIENDYAKDYADFSNNNEHIIDYDSRSWYWFQDVWENSIGLIINFVNNVDGNNKRDTDSSLIGEIHYDHDNDVISIDDDDLAIDKSNDHNVNDGNMNDDSDDINGDDDDEISKNSYDNYKIKNKVNSNDGKVGDTFGSQKIDKWYKRKSVINIDNDVDKDDDTIYRNTMSYKSNRAVPKKRGKIIAIDENRATKSDKWLARLYRASRNIDKLKRSSAKVFVEVENDYDIIRTDSDVLPDNYRRPNNEDQITSVDNNFDQTDDSDEDEGTRVEDDESNEDQDDVVNSENEDNDDVSEDKSTENSDSGENKIEGNNYYYEDDSDDEQNSIDIKIYNNEEENSDNIADTAEFNDESDEDNISDEVDSSSEEESTEEDQLNEEESSHGKRVYAKDRSQYIKSDYKNAVLKISIGISLIFVGYTVIIKKWRTYDDVVDESSASTKKREDELAKQTVQDVIDQISEELIQDQYKHDDDDEDEEEDSAEFPSDNEDGHDDVFLEENYVSSSSESSDEEREVKEQTNDYSRSDIRPVRTVTGNYNDDTNTTIDSDFERQENSSENLEPHWTASGPSILAREVEQSDESGSEEEEEEIEQTDDSENESDASNYDHSPKLYSRANITNQSDWVIKDELDEADSDLDEGNDHR